MSDLLDEIRAKAAEVASRASLVRIDDGRLAGYARSLPLQRLARPELHPERHLLGQGEATLSYFLVLDSINFGSGYFPRLRKRPGMSGYFTVATALTEHCRAHGVPPPEALARLSAADCAAIFGQDLADPAVAELMGHFATALGDLGRLVLDRYQGRFANLVAAAGHSAARLLDLLRAMPYYNDVLPYDELRVPFFKRGQIAAADLALALGGEGLGRFDDLARLTIFADNLVPHVLRIDRVLVYDPGLAERIDREELIASGSKEEVEIRGVALDAVERMVALFAAAGRAVTAAQVDYLLWHRGQLPYYKNVKPRHRARSVFY